MGTRFPNPDAPPLRRLRRISLAGAAAVAVATMSGCHGLLFGAGFGALAGQAIGGSTEATLAGAFYGGVVGAAVEYDHHAHVRRYEYRHHHHGCAGHRHYDY